MAPPVSSIKMENPGYYCNSYTPPAPDHAPLMTTVAYSPLSLPRSSQSPGEPRTKRLRRLSSEDDLELGAGPGAGAGPGGGVGGGGPAPSRDKPQDVTYYSQSPASLSSQASWHSDVDHGLGEHQSCVLYTGLPSPHGSVSLQHTTSYYSHVHPGHHPDPGQQQQQQSPNKYPENGHDTLSDFVTFVCNQEGDPSQQVSSGRSPTRLSQYYSSSMLPPPPPPPMARPVAIIRSTGSSGDLPSVGAHTPPPGGPGPHSPGAPMGGPESPRGGRSSGAVSPSQDQQSRSVVTSPFAVSREYAFSHIHQPGQLFSYPSMSVSAASSVGGMVSASNLSLLVSSPGASRGAVNLGAGLGGAGLGGAGLRSPAGSSVGPGGAAGVPVSLSGPGAPPARWNPAGPTAFIGIDEEYGMMAPLLPAGVAGDQPSQQTLIDDDRYFTVAPPHAEPMDTSQDLGGPGPPPPGPPPPVAVQGGPQGAGPGSTGSHGSSGGQSPTGSGPPTPAKPS
ncbi:hypothetical protein KUF71_020122 [Frankliniella fusca]|uniref:Uncharacterized protein n=1 Tax=Frankliniella fusca TaxID=407009 RepID=A0AAE1L8G4_9NEOP|nr:hypothetical protein KUF71_020122 [Frankliniella fusca]